MKRFVDVRVAEIGGRFAWYDTVADQFETHAGSMVWETFREFADDYDGDEIERYRSLTPDWAFGKIEED